MLQENKTDKETIIEMLERAGFKIDFEMWTSNDGEVNLGVEGRDGSVGFSFDNDGNLKEVWGRDW